VALGAQPVDVLRMILGEGMLLTLPGLGAGWLLAVAMARLVSASLVRVSPNDPSIYTAAAVFTVLVALGAAARPARRAAKVDPMVALRCE
jgi:putative ABC transport system permease protein